MAYGVITTDKNGISNSFNDFKTTLSLDTVSLPINSQLVITNSLFIANNFYLIVLKRDYRIYLTYYKSQSDTVVIKAVSGEYSVPSNLSITFMYGVY